MERGFTEFRTKRSIHLRFTIAIVELDRARFLFLPKKRDEAIDQQLLIFDEPLLVVR
jgi:hypothetical protein